MAEKNKLKDIQSNMRLAREWKPRKDKKKMRPTTKKMLLRGFIVASGVWIILAYTFVVVIGSGFAISEFLVLGVLPLLIGWGAYWVVKAKKD